MKCLNCTFENLPKSDFCQECGTPLRESSKNDQQSFSSTLSKEMTGLDDVIFKPRKKGGIIRTAFIAIVVMGGLFVGGLLLITLLLSDSTGDATPSETEQTTFPISYLNIIDPKIEYIDGEAYFVGILKNIYSRPARNVMVRVDFYYDEDLKKHFDTRNVTITNGAENNGAFSFQVPLTFYPRGAYWYLWKIERADYDMQ